MKNDKPTFLYFLLLLGCTPIFFFALLVAYKEGCFGQVFNLDLEEISRHSFVPFVFYLFDVLSLKTILIELQKF
jgi:hypothetical protein